MDLEWHCFLLRPVPQERSLEQFKAYTQRWKRPDAMEKEAEFTAWSSDEGPPSHSVPAHLVAKAAAGLGKDYFEKLHEGLMKAYFTENRNIADIDVLKALWVRFGLPPESFERHADPEILEAVLAEHKEAVQNGVSGVPAVMIEGVPGALVGAQETDVYRRLIRRVLNDPPSR